MYEKREEEHGWMVSLFRYWGVNDEKSREMIARRYIERFVGCIENLTNSKCDLKHKEKRANVKKMILNPRVSEALKEAKPKSLYMKILLVPIRWKNVTLTILEAKFIFDKSKKYKIICKIEGRKIEMENKIWISIIMPTYNSEKIITSSIQSILGQTLDEIELIVIDDCSTDNTVEKIRKSNNRIIEFV